VSLSDWNTNFNGIKTAFIAAIAAGAGVPIAQISITNAQIHVNSPGGRRLFSVENTKALRSTRELRDAKPKDRVRVSFEVKGVDRRHDVRRGLSGVLAGVF
jgi:hypothetical protein